MAFVWWTMIPADRVITAGTDRSMPPDMITSNCPAAAIARTPASAVTSVIESVWNTAGLLIRQRMISAASAIQTTR